MKINMKLNNYGTLNIGENINNNYYNINLIQELNILKENCKEESDKNNIESAIILIKQNKYSKAKEILTKLGKNTLNLIKDLSLSILTEFIMCV